jgi:anti-sigma factor ChrR (cupin superfamily)
MKTPDLEGLPPEPGCEAVRPLLPGYAEQLLSPTEKARVEAHLPNCHSCQQRLHQYQLLLGHMAAAPPLHPPAALSLNFEAMLAAEKAELARATPQAAAVPLWPKQVVRQGWLRAAASVLLVAAGLGAGWLLHALQTESVTATAQPRSALAVALAAAAAEPGTASTRIQLVSTAATQPDDQTVPVLMQTLTTDPNPNVRLAAAEGLFLLRNDARVGPGLVEALRQQTDPNVQIMLIQLLVALRERDALPQLQQLANQHDALSDVRRQAKQGISTLL